MLCGCSVQAEQLNLTHVVQMSPLPFLSGKSKSNQRYFPKKSPKQAIFVASQKISCPSQLYLI